ERGLQISPLIQRARREAGPIGEDTTAPNRATEKKRRRTRPVIGAPSAVDSDGSSELGGQYDSRVLPDRAELLLQRPQAGVQCGEATRELAFSAAFIGMSIPADGVEHRHLRTVFATQEARGCIDDLAVASATLCHGLRGSGNLIRGKCIRQAFGKQRIRG